MRAFRILTVVCLSALAACDDTPVQETDIGTDTETETESETETDPKGPDFAGVGLSNLRGRMLPGNEVSVTIEVENVGDQASVASEIAFYFSTDRDRPEQVYLGSVVLDPTSAGWKVNETIRLPVPEFELPSGEVSVPCWLTIEVDPENVVDEFDETNNVSAPLLASCTHGLPDLVVVDVSERDVPEVLRPGSRLEVNFDYANDGERDLAGIIPDVDSFEGSVVFAEDVEDPETWHIWSTLYGPIDWMNAGNEGEAWLWAEVPDTEESLTGTLGVLLDATDTYEELDEDNNVAWLPRQHLWSRPGPADLLVASVTAPKVGAPGAPITVKFDVSNSGETAVAMFDVAYFLSTDATWDGGDPALGTGLLSGLAAGAKRSESVSLTPDKSTSVGDYYVIVRLDPDRKVPQADITNDTAASSIFTIKIDNHDLQPSKVVASPSPVKVGASLSVSFDLANNGTDLLASSSYSVVLSKDVAIDGTDPVVCIKSAGAISSKSKIAVRTSCVVPKSTAAGAYYVGVRADPGSVITETDETNNTAVTASTVSVTVPSIDLLPTFVTGPSSATAGSSTLRSWSVWVENKGTDASGSYDTSIYLSKTGSIGSGAPKICTVAFGSLAGKTKGTYTAKCAVPAGVAKGTWYIGTKLDVGGKVKETNEGNNSHVTTAYTITIY